MDAALEELVPRRARFRFEYCLLPQALISTPFQFDHIIAQFHDGPTTAENLAFACFHCNNFKGTNLAGVDPDTGKVVRLFHPRTDLYQENFRWDGRAHNRTDGRGARHNCCITVKSSTSNRSPKIPPA
jgi:HNH endonuclease.